MAIMGRREEPQNASQRPNRSDALDAHTILGQEARFSGKLAFEGAVRIDGHFDGEISTNDVLLVGPTAQVRAELKVGSIVIHGFVEGNIVAKESVEIKAPARVRGNISAPNLTIERGVRFDGSCQMSGDAAADTTSASKQNGKKAQSAPAAD